MRRVLLIVMVLLLAVPVAADAAPKHHKSTVPKQPPATGPVLAPQTNPSSPATSSSTTAAPTTASSGGVSSAPDTSQQLGATEGVCSNLTGATVTVVRNCKASGNAESPFPASNYGLDTNVNTGLVDPGSDAASIFQHTIGWVFGLIAWVVHLIFVVLGFAFSFDLFGSDHTGHIPHALGLAESLFTVPVLPLAFVFGAVFGLAHWAKGSAGRAVSHWATMLALMTLGLVITLDPVGVLGWVDSTANGAAASAVSAFSGSSGHGSASYGNTSMTLWGQMVERPWCAMEFGDVSWCMAAPSPDMQAARTDVLKQLDQSRGSSTLTSVPLTGPQPIQATTGSSGPFTPQEAPAEKLRLQDAQTNGQMFLAFPPNDDARNRKNDSSWTLYAHLLKSTPELAPIRGSGGVGQRIMYLALILVGVVCFVLLLSYVSLNLLAASLFFVLALLFAPLMCLAPAFGEKGRDIFVKWLEYLIGALAAKLIYSIYLGVVVLGSSLVIALGQGVGGWGASWLLFAGFWVLAWNYRRKLLGVFTAGAHERHEHHHNTVALLGALAITRGGINMRRRAQALGHATAQ